MRALVVHEPIFGDGRAVAEAIALGLSPTATTLVLPASDAPADVGRTFDLVVVGSPDHAFGLPGPGSHDEARSRGPDAVVRRGVREWLATVTTSGDPPVWAAAWDTRLAHPGVMSMVDHAASTILRELRRAGFRMLTPPEHFLVADARGPLLDGELDRARCWGAHLAQQMIGQRVLHAG